MDHKKLLKKYIEYILDIEGHTFIDGFRGYMSGVRFTAAEQDLLEQIENDILLKNTIPKDIFKKAKNKNDTSH